MKGLNVKRIVALGLGAALVGSALAPAVMAAAYSNMDQLKKENIVDATGTPVVDIIVGSMGQAPDVVWAGNIAAKVAQLATVDVAGSGTKTVDITVGGTSTTSGAGDTVESAVDYSAQEAAFNGIQVTDSKMPSLVNETSAKLTWAGTEYTTTVREVLKASSDVDFQGSTSSTAYAAGELYASINAGDLNYSIELGSPGIPLSANAYKNLDGNADYDVKIPFLGKTYVLDETTADSLIMYADTTPTDMKVGDKMTVTPNTSYVGKKMEVQLVDLIQVGSGNTTYEPKWALLIDGVATKYVQQGATSTYDLRTQFGKSYFTDSIYVTAAGLNLAANTYTATVRTGAQRIELKDGKGYPFTDDSTVDNYAAWKVDLVGNPVTKIVLQNQWAYSKTSGTESDNSNTKFVLKAGEEVKLPNDFAAFKFTGLQVKPTTEVQIGEVSGIESGGVKYIDARGNTISVPFYKQFTLDFNVPTEITISGKDYTFWIDSNPAYDMNVAYIEGKHSDAVVHDTWTDIDVNKNKVLAGATVSLDLGAENTVGTTVNTDYIFVADNNSGNITAGLVLKGAQTFYLQNKADSTARPKLVFDETAVKGAYYVPNTEDFLNTILNNSIGAYDSAKHFSAEFTYTDNANDVANLYIETGDTAKAWEYKAIKSSDNNLVGPTLDANTADWSIGTDVDNMLSAAMTEDGTLIESDGSVFTLVVPDENRNAEAYLGGTATSTTTTGGTTYTGVAAGETKGNVTVTNITGATAGKAIVPVGNIVKLDTDMANGKSIIVGGFMVNKAASNLVIKDGQTLDTMLTASGDYVAAVLADGKIVVAGWTASDTADAAKALIAALDKF
ncbi:MAG: S-layer protein [archaeon]|jgi:hypothetical protein